MEHVIAWAAFAGAWLLVAGPLYQGALELHEQDVDREGLEASKSRVEPPEMPSPWWWLLPPVFYLLWRQRSREYRRAVFDQLTPEQKEQFSSFVNKALSWFTVSLSGPACWPPGRPGGSPSATSGRSGCSGCSSSSWAACPC